MKTVGDVLAWIVGAIIAGAALVWLAAHILGPIAILVLNVLTDLKRRKRGANIPTAWDRMKGMKREEKGLALLAFGLFGGSALTTGLFLIGWGEIAIGAAVVGGAMMLVGACLIPDAPSKNERVRRAREAATKSKYVPVARSGYAAYLASPAWQVKRTAALARADGRCQLCYGRYRLEVHHRTYERLGNERESDLVVLCRSCHEKFHDKLNA